MLKLKMMKREEEKLRVVDELKEEQKVDQLTPRSLYIRDFDSLNFGKLKLDLDNEA